jgi:hypothetical protein
VPFTRFGALVSAPWLKVAKIEKPLVSPLGSVQFCSVMEACSDKGASVFSS